MLDLLIHNAAIVTVDLHDTIIERGTILVEGGRLVAVRPTRPDDATLSARVTLDGTGRAVLPGLVNAHVHTGQSLLLGRFSQFSGLEVMLESAALGRVLDQARTDSDPFLARWTEASWRLGTLNMIRSGITLFNNMGRSTPTGAAVVGQAGLRAVLGPTLGDELLGEDAGAQLARARLFIEQFHGAYDGRIRAAVCPHGDLYTSRPLWELCALLAADYPAIRVHTHLLETPASNRAAQAMGAADSVGLLADLGLLNNRLILAHFLAATPADVARVLEAGAAVVHCPTIVSYFGTGQRYWIPLPDLVRGGGTVALGLDDPGWIDSWDLFREAKTALGLANFLWGAQQFTPQQMLRMLTIAGAQALGLGDETGSLEVGKWADLIMLDVTGPHFAPLNNLPALLVNTATSGDVETVVVGGQVLMQARQILTLDSAAVLAEVQAVVEESTPALGWEVGLAASRPLTPAAARLPRGGKALDWADRMRDQALGQPPNAPSTDAEESVS